MGLFNVQEICVRTDALGLGGKVTISHGFCLGGITERKAGEAADMMAKAGVALVTHGAGGLTLPPIEMLRAAGVLVFAGQRRHPRHLVSLRHRRPAGARRDYRLEGRLPS